jgi:transposase-like protein
MDATYTPKTLLQAIRYVSDLDVCQKLLIEARWPDGVTCPTCGRTDVSYLDNQKRWQCKTKHARRQFSVKIGTIFEDSPIGLDKWFTAMWLIAGAKNGISSYKLHRAIGVTQKTAWFMNHRIRLAMQSGTFSKLSGHVEADETYIGGKARNMHFARRERMLKGRESGATGKTAVMSLLARHGKDGHSVVRTEVVPNVQRRNLQLHIRKHVQMDGETVLYSDSLKSYEPVNPPGWMPSDLYIHKVIDHAEKYVNGEVHTNGMENFWSLLKRSIRGTYVSVEPFHLFRYLDEQAYRFNNRHDNDAGRFAGVLASVTGRRLTYKNLIGEQPA